MSLLASTPMSTRERQHYEFAITGVRVTQCAWHPKSPEWVKEVRKMVGEMSFFFKIDDERLRLVASAPPNDLLTINSPTFVITTLYSKETVTEGVRCWVKLLTKEMNKKHQESFEIDYQLLRIIDKGTQSALGSNSSA